MPQKNQTMDQSEPKQERITDRALDLVNQIEVGVKDRHEELRQLNEKLEAVWKDRDRLMQLVVLMGIKLGYEAGVRIDENAMKDEYNLPVFVLNVGRDNDSEIAFKIPYGHLVIPQFDHLPYTKNMGCRLDLLADRE